jgi:hypothetical protein
MPPGPGGHLRIAQAGKANLFDSPIERGFGHLRPEFFLHP